MPPEPTPRHIRVPRTARYHVFGSPAQATEVWFVLHGYRQLAGRFLRRFRDLPGAGGSRCVVAPEALSRFYVEREVGPHGPGSRVGASWMTRTDREHEIRDYVEYLDRVVGTVLTGEGQQPLGAEAPAAAAVEGGDRRLVVLGFSQGCETASRWVTYGRIRPAELVLWGGGIATDLEESAARDALGSLRIRGVVGSDDRWAARRWSETGEQLAALGLDAERIDYPGGHDIDADVLSRYWPV